MDGEGFDRLARTLTTTAGSRRAGLRLAMTGGALLALGAVGRAPVVAAPAPQGKRCKAPRTRCGRHCVNLARDPKHCGACHTPCGDSQACNLGSCQACIEVGDNCQFTSDCCNNGVLTTICLDNPACGALPAGSRCCRTEGSPCKGNCDCCPGLKCKANGRCG